MERRHIEIVAEAGVNHNGSVDTAFALVDAARQAGADVIKFQTFITEKTLRRTDPDFERIKALELSPKDFIAIARRCERVGIEFLSTPDETDSLKFLVEEVGVKRIKIGSADLLNWPLVSAAYRTGLPVILSTGMAIRGEIIEVTAIDYDITLLHCVSLYPTFAVEANIAAMDELATLGFPVGYSDHTLGHMAPIIAASRGAVMIEKHFTLNSALPGPDNRMSIEPYALKEMVNSIRLVEAMLGHGRKEPCVREKEAAPRLRKAKDGLRGLAA